MDSNHPSTLTNQNEKKLLTRAAAVGQATRMLAAYVVGGLRTSFS